MTSQVFYRKWRPQTLAEIVGQAQVTQTLTNALASGRVSHAYLFYGHGGRPLSYEAARKRFMRLLRVAGLEEKVIR